ncbi:PepSY domain-containing protein [Flammeovirga sp. SJP92]|uniref:PepSY-associated TM helix domain-containing protein n=1 Tax=Flammeovirga sp. SJP92 TaxID=1775430 RepID=UPI0009EEFD22|nr:PepSY-associated TM helix domain-containing protein [Flammeovirga sp. SJP92]
MKLSKSLLRKKRKNESLLKYFMSLSHLWLGLLSIVVLIVVCLTGAVFAFKNQITELLNYDVVFNKDKSAKEWVSPDDINNNFISKGLEIISIDYPADFKRNILVSYQNSTLNQKGSVYIHPSNGEVVGKQYVSTASFFQTVKALHKNLLLGEVGKQIVGVSVLIFVFLLLSGIVLWFPKNKIQLKNSLNIKWSAKLPRVIYDLHRVIGFYFLFPLVFISITGLYVAYPWMKSVVLVSLGGQPVLNESNKEEVQEELSNKFASFLEESLNVHQEEMAEVVSIDLLLKDVNQRLPYKGSRSIALAINDKTEIEVTKINQEGWLNIIAPDKITYNQNGEFKKEVLFSDLTLSDQFKAVSLPLHTGEILGLPGVIFYFIVTLIGCSLPITGILIWVRKL